MNNYQLTYQLTEKKRSSSFSLFVLCSIFSIICICSLLSCNNLFQPSNPEKTAGKTGYLSLSIGGIQIGRTIMPVTDGIKYRLEITNTAAHDPLTLEELPNAPIPLLEGTYNLKVTAYMNDYTMPAAEKSQRMTINAGRNTTITLTLLAILEEGEGTFSWDITYADGITVRDALMTVTRFTDNGEVSEDPLYIDHPGTKILNTGYYRVVIKLTRLKDGIEETAELREILHIYPNMESVFKPTITNSHFTSAIFVTNNADTGNGSLRWAIEEAQKRANSTIIIDSSVKTIVLTGSLPLTIGTDNPINLTIEGNGVTITQSFLEDVPLLEISSESSNITIRRVHFDGGQAQFGGAIYNNSQANITLESCIFSGNQAYTGGAINTIGNLYIKGCTFYGNSATSYGGAIYTSGGDMFFEGNLFYGNTAGTHPVISPTSSGTMTSYGCNVVDVPFNASPPPNNPHCGWDQGDGDIYVTSPVVMQKTFKPISESETACIIDSLYTDYPTIDFYGRPIVAPASPGAVQETTAETYYQVTFDTHRLPTISPIVVSPHDKIDKPADPVSSVYNFDRWYKDSNYSTIWDFAIDTVDVPTTLYAKWTYTVEFFNNYEDGETNSQLFTLGIEQPLKENSFNRLNYDFVGWAVESDGDVVYRDQETVNNLIPNSDKTVNLYAVWKSDEEDVADWLMKQPGGNSSNDPVFLSLQINLGTMTAEESGWRQLLTAIDTAGKFVKLDLSACSINATETTIIFNPDSSVATGKEKIVEIFLPDTAIKIADGNSDNPTFKSFTNLTSFSGMNLTTIGDYAFYGCTNLAKLDLGATEIKTIGEYAFQGCTSLQTIYLPATLSSIGDSAFKGCTELMFVTCYADTPPTLTNQATVFASCNELQYIFVQITAIGDYKTSWGSYASKIDGIPK
jgi:uncharacterized repeat protein (TIGR02543 family)